MTMATETKAWIDDRDAQSAAERRARITADIVARTGINAEMIHDLVHGFYARVRQDALLGPVFDARVRDWDAHLARMCAFWSSVALMSGLYHGRPMEKHLPLPVDGRYFDRWLALFEETAQEVCPPQAADHFMDRARRIAESMELGIASQSGVFLTKGARFIRADLRGADLPGHDLPE
jgi:hemoglobin